MRFLNEIIKKKKVEIDKLYEEKGIDYFINKLAEKPLVEPKFQKALLKPGLSLIAEIKKASPSKGIIYPDFDPELLSENFSKKGASALSILTEKHYFLGHPNYITKVKNNSSLPILQKDFILDPIQVVAAKLLGADAILLIKACLTNIECQELIDTAKEYKLDVLLEIHNENELDAIRILKNITIIGINNRDLNTFKINCQTAKVLYQEIKRLFPKDIILIAESGYHKSKELEELEKMGFQGVLIGEGLASNNNLLNFFEKKY